jgi:hypothetical protein
MQCELPRILPTIPKNPYLSPVKGIAIFMSVWVLFLSLLPCNDVDDHTHFETHATPGETHLQSDNHNEHGIESEHCAPFCHCNCCQSTVTLHHHSLLIRVAEVSATWFPVLHDQFEARHQVSIWHPPMA